MNWRKNIIVLFILFFTISMVIGSASSIDTVAKTTKKTTKTTYWSKSGISADKKYVIGIGKKSSGFDKIKSNKLYVAKYYNICPYCKHHTLFWASGKYGRKVYNPYKKRWYYEGNNFPEGHFFCSHCDMDWSIAGNEHVYYWQKNHKLKKYGSIKKSSLKQKNQLSKGKLVYKKVIK